MIGDSLPPLPTAHHACRFTWPRLQPHPHDGGVVLVILLLGLALLAGLVLYVINLGQQVAGRVVTQHSADASVTAGAGWVARTLNTVAMDNTGIAQSIACVNVLDAMPLAVGYTYLDQDALLRASQGQLNRGISNERLTDFLTRLVTDLQNEVEILQPMDQYLNHSGYDIAEMTYYSSLTGSGQGKLWKAMNAMDRQSQTMMENLGSLAQFNAVRGGMVNAADDTDHQASSAAACFMAPLTPLVPYKRGQFDDFREPVMRGILPSAIDDKQYRRGPYDVLFGWRSATGIQVSGSYSEPTTQITQSGQGNLPFSGGMGSTGRTFTPSGPPTASGYSVHGPLSAMLDDLSGYAANHLRHSRFASYLNQAVQIKIGRLWYGEGISDTNTVLPNLRVLGYRDGELRLNQPIVKDYYYWYDGPNMLRTNPPLFMFYLEDGVNTSSDDLVLKVENLPGNVTQVTYMNHHTMGWIYDIVADTTGADGQTITVPLLTGLGRGNNGNLRGTYSATIPTPTPQTRIIEPNWVIDYSQAAAIAASNPASIVETAFAVYEAKSNAPIPDNGQTAGQLIVDLPGIRTPRIVRQPGWYDVSRAGTVPMNGNYYWIDHWNYQVSYDTSLGLPPVTDPDTGLVTSSYTIYRADYIVFLGVNIGTAKEVRDPYNFTNRNQLPAPIDLDHSAVATSAAARRQYLTFLGLARRDDTALLWPNKFRSRKPYANQLAIAQAQVFNNLSWDLWTQGWQTQLETIKDYPGWITTLQQGYSTSDDGDGASSATSVPGLSIQDVTQMTQYLQSLSGLSDVMLSH